MIRKAQLAVTENLRLSQCEQIIESGFNVFVEVGRALAEIRNEKLYRAGHETFEAYCKARWNIGRSRAYELIDQATVVAAITKAGVDLSATADISKRDVRALKQDLPAATKQIKDKVKKGADPAEATAAVVAQIAAAKETAKADKKTQQAEFERQREEHKAALPDAIKERAQAKADAIARSKSDLGDDQSAQDRIAELEEAVRVLEAENAELRAEVAKFGPMRVQFEQGGFEKVIADKDELLRVADARIVSESADKASWMKSAKYWQDEAKKRGWSDTVTIDIETGEVVNG